MAVKLPGSVTALFQSLRYSSNAKHHQQLQPGSTFSSHGAWTRLKRTGGLCFPGNIAKDRQDFFGRIVGLAAPFTVPRSIALDQKSLQVSCALSSFEVWIPTLIFTTEVKCFHNLQCFHVLSNRKQSYAISTPGSTKT